jgi:geranylgeranyl reductase family protein
LVLLDKLRFRRQTTDSGIRSQRRENTLLEQSGIPGEDENPIAGTGRNGLIKPQLPEADVVIVGAGPAGCGAAYDLATGGLRVMLLDRAEFPRKKTCAGGLTVKSLRALRYRVDPLVLKTVRTLSVSCRMHHRRRLTSSTPICYLVERTAFDDFCLQQTLSTGVRFERVKRIDRILETNRRVSLVTDGGVIRSRYVIGADGVHSRVRQLTERFAGMRFAFAVEGIVERAPSERLDMGFDFSWVKDGYGWVFPKDGHINVGLYRLGSTTKLTRRRLIDYAVRRIGDPQPVRIAGYPLGLGGWRYRPGRGRVLLVGDAAGLVDPLLGEGLYNAITSGQQAAAAIGAALHDGGDACRRYAQALKPIQHDLRFSRLAALFFYRFPGTGHWLLTSPAASIALMKGFSQGLPLISIFCRGCRDWRSRGAAVQQKTNSL